MEYALVLRSPSTKVRQVKLVHGHTNAIARGMKESIKVHQNKIVHGNTNPIAGRRKDEEESEHTSEGDEMHPVDAAAVKLFPVLYVIFLILFFIVCYFYKRN